MLFRTRHDRGRQRVFTASLQARREAQHLGFVDTRAANQRNEARLAFRQRAGLVHGHRVHLFHPLRSEEHTSELQSLMRISYAVFCLKKKKTHTQTQITSSRNTKSHTNTTSI